MCVSGKGESTKNLRPLVLSLFPAFDSRFREFNSIREFYSLVKVPEEVGEIEVAQRGVGFRSSLRVRREERVRD